MPVRYIFALFVGVVLAGWIIPAQQTPEAPDDAPILQAQDQTQMQAALQTEEPTEEAEENEGTVLTRKSDGHFYVNAAVDGGEVKFMVDTGASSIALTGADAEALGIDWDDSNLQLVGRGVSGNVYGKPVVLKTVRVGDIVAHDVQAAIIPEGLDVSLLGQSFLSKVGNVNIQGNEMTFN